MNPRVRVEPLDHASASVAVQIHAVQMAAYSREAELIGAKDFPPLARTREGLRLSKEQFFGAYVGVELVAVASVELGEARVGISSLVVVPEWHRQGVGGALLRHLVKRYGAREVHVQTAARNYPALALYRQGGFVEVLRWSVGTAPLELVALRRFPASTQNVA